MIYVCGLRTLPEHASVLRPTRVVSLVAPEEQPETPPGVAAEMHLRIACHDIVDPEPERIVPAEEHVERLVGFARAWDGETTLLIHCVAGVSRSTAAALTVAAVHRPGRELELARRLRDVAAHVDPNPRIVQLADAALGAEGRLVEAVRAMGPPLALGDNVLVRLALDGD